MKDNPPLGKHDRPIFLKKMAYVPEDDGGETSSEDRSPLDTSLWFNRDVTDDGEDLTIYINPLDEDAFEHLSTRDTLPEELPEFARGRTRNRYWDILPNPVTRVRLDVQRNDPTTEYINANYVRGFGDRSVREYIAAQGPEVSTVVGRVNRSVCFVVILYLPPPLSSSWVWTPRSHALHDRPPLMACRKIWWSRWCG